MTIVYHAWRVSEYVTIMVLALLMRELENELKNSDNVVDGIFRFI
ncbi:hypothetical protein HMPREF0693_1561 [Proteus mirabilis ATCC 29906]|nr:hypothetical protein HMPREF0693_1561 [Proteus mirabilis ATCC 29906]